MTCWSSSAGRFPPDDADELKVRGRRGGVRPRRDDDRDRRLPARRRRRLRSVHAVPPDVRTQVIERPGRSSRDNDAISNYSDLMLAYLDPGAGSLILQALAGGVAGACRLREDLLGPVQARSALWPRRRHPGLGQPPRPAPQRRTQRAPNEASTARGFSRSFVLPSYPFRFLHLVALWSYAVSQPVFSMLHGNPEFLVIRGSTRLEMVIFAALPRARSLRSSRSLSEWVVSRLSSRVADALHLMFVGVFVIPLALFVLKQIGPGEAASIVAASIVAAAAVALYGFKVVQLFLTLVAHLAGSWIGAVHDQHAARRRRRGRREGTRWQGCAGGRAGPRRAPSEFPHDAGREHRLGSLPELRTACRRFDVVPTYDDRARAHRGGGAGNSHGTAAARSPAPNAQRPSRESLHALGRGLRAPCARDRHVFVSGALLPT